jgi:N-acetylglucosamine malate deacetylase 2
MNTSRRSTMGIAGRRDTGAALMAALRAPAAECPLPRTVVVIAHPDDESVGAGARLERLASSRFVYVTDGAPADGEDAASHGLSPAAYAGLRQRELRAALALCGIGFGQVIRLEYPDQGAALHLARLAEELSVLFAAWGAQVVLTHPYEGGHPDHDATAFAVHAAVAAMRPTSPAAAPAIVEIASYHMGPGGILPGAFLPDPAADAAGVSIELTPEEQRRKRALFECHASQRATLAHFPIGVERFRPAPQYDFTRPPHDGKLFYECQRWGMTGARFSGLAARALAELGLEGRL